MKTHGSRVTRGHGMRRGISLMEMLIAIILLGVISSVGYNYYKNYYDTALASKQTKTAIIIDQANQLKNMLELHKIKFGVDVTETQKLDRLITQGFLTEIPEFIPDMAEAQANGWVLLDTVNVGSASTPAVGTTATDLILTYTLNSTSSTALDKLAYCQTLNNIATNGVEVYSSDVTDLDDDAAAAHAITGSSFFCYDSSANNDSSEVTFYFVAKFY